MAGPYQPGDVARIPLETTLNGAAINVDNPRVQRLILPDQTNASGFPKAMTQVDTGTYILEFPVKLIGNYTAIIRAEITNSEINNGVTTTLEEIESFVVELGFYKIEPACD